MAANKPVQMSLFKPVYLDQRVALSPNEMSRAAGDMDGFLVNKLRSTLEGKCCTHGWVLPGSTSILSRSMGGAEHGRFTGDFLFQCKVKIACYQPIAEQRVDARVLLVNKLGAYVLIVDQGELREAARILLPREYHEGNAEFDALQPGAGIKVKILTFRFQANDSFINAVGTYEGAVPEASGVAAPLQPAVPPTEAPSQSQAEAPSQSQAEAPSQSQTTVVQPSEAPSQPAAASETAAEAPAAPEPTAEAAAAPV
jgi:hypothetical protein